MSSLVLGTKYTKTNRIPTTSGGSGLTKMAARIAVAVTQPVLGVRFDPAPAYLFVVELEGIAIGLFTECSGLGVKRDVEEYKEGGVNHYVHKLPGRLEFKNIVLKRGLSLSQALWDWFSIGAYDFNVQRMNFSIIQGAPGHNFATAVAGAVGLTSSESGETWQSAAQNIAFQVLGGGFGKVKHWNVEDAYPVHWEVASLTTSSTMAAIEEIEIAHHGLSLTYEVGTPMSPGASVLGVGLSAL